jgi:hypothetical protein
VIDRVVEVGHQHGDQRLLVHVPLDQEPSGDAHLEIAQGHVGAARRVHGDVRYRLDRDAVDHRVDVGVVQPAVHLGVVRGVVAFDAVGPTHRDGQVDPLVTAGRKVHPGRRVAGGSLESLDEFLRHLAQRERTPIAAPAQSGVRGGLGRRVGSIPAGGPEADQQIGVVRVGQQRGFQLPALGAQP